MKRFVDGKETEFTDSDSVRVDTLSDRLVLHSAEGAFSAVSVFSGETALISYKGRQYKVEKSSSRTRASQSGESGELFAPMPGQIVDVRVFPGDRVEDGQKLLVLEAMKTQQPFMAPFAGVVDKVFVETGDQVQEGQMLAVILPSEA